MPGRILYYHKDSNTILTILYNNVLSAGHNNPQRLHVKRLPTVSRMAEDIVQSLHKEVGSDFVDVV